MLNVVDVSFREVKKLVSGSCLGFETDFFKYNFHANSIDFGLRRIYRFSPDLFNVLRNRALYVLKLFIV